jgi:hypothetical protein
VSGPGIVHPISAGDCLGEDAEKLVQRANGCRRIDHHARCAALFFLNGSSSHKTPTNQCATDDFQTLRFNYANLTNRENVTW